LAIVITIYHYARSSECQIKQNIQDYDQQTNTHTEKKIRTNHIM